MASANTPLAKASHVAASNINEARNTLSSGFKDGWQLVVLELAQLDFWGYVCMDLADLLLTVSPVVVFPK